MSRIRTLKPEFWSHPILARQDADTRLLAIALLNLADDEGYFQAEAALVRGFARPFDEDSVITQRALNNLSEIKYITIHDTSEHGKIGKIEKFLNNQRIDRPTVSKLKDYFDSPSIPRALDEPSTPEGKGKEGNRDQGTGNREQGKKLPENQTLPVGKGASKPSDYTFLDQIIQCFVEIHGSYEVLNRGVERAAAGKLAALYRKKYPEAKTAEVITGMQEFFRLCININDDWLRTNMSLSIIVSKFNQITKILNNGNSKRRAATTEEVANLIARKYGSDAPKSDQPVPGNADG